MTPTRKAYIQLHTAVILFGFTAILGKLISLAEIPLVWYRLIFTVASLCILPPVWKGLKAIPKADRLKLAGIGIVVATHWVCFYGSIKYSNVTVALSALSTISFFTSFLEPLITGERFKPYEAILGVLVIIGMIILFQFGGGYITGIILGLLAALLAALFSIWNRNMVAKYNALSITTLELGSGLIYLTLVIGAGLLFGFHFDLSPAPTDWAWLIILAIACTTVAYVLTLESLKHISAFTSALAINLEPIYGILLAIPFFNENDEIHPYFYFGTACIVLAVIIHPFLQKRFDSAH